MSSKYIDFLDSARQMASHTSEIDFRNAISRSYYSSFHACSPKGDTLPDYVKDARGERVNGMHARFIAKFRNSSDQKIRQIGFMLDHSHRQRCRADYHMNDDFSKNEAETLILQADNIIKLVTAL